MKTNKEYAVPALMKGMDILDLIAERESVSFTEICTTLNFSKSTVYALVNTLLQRGCLRTTPQNTYRLGLKLFSLGSKALVGLDIREEALPLMHRLTREINQTSHLGVLDGNSAVYLAKVECAQNLIVRSWVGRRIPLQTSAMGKVLLAWRPENEAKLLLQGNAPTRYTSRALLNEDDFIKHLDNVRKNGIALDDRETAEEIICVSAPVFSTQLIPVGAISVSVPFEQLTADNFLKITKQVHQTGADLSERLGGSYYPSFYPLEFPGGNHG